MLKKMHKKHAFPVFSQEASHIFQWGQWTEFLFIYGSKNEFFKNRIFKKGFRFSEKFKHFGGPCLRHKESSQMLVSKTFLVKMSL
jgi:hypothetical protein